MKSWGTILHDTGKLGIKEPLQSNATWLPKKEFPWRSNGESQPVFPYVDFS